MLSNNRGGECEHWRLALGPICTYLPDLVTNSLEPEMVFYSAFYSPQCLPYCRSSIIIHCIVHTAFPSRVWERKPFHIHPSASKTISNPQLTCGKSHLKSIAEPAFKLLISLVVNLLLVNSTAILPPEIFWINMGDRIPHPLLFHFCTKNFIWFVFWNGLLVSDLSSQDMLRFPNGLTQSHSNNTFL